MCTDTCNPGHVPSLCALVCFSVDAKMPWKALWGHCFLLEKRAGRVEEKIEEGDPRPLLCSGRAGHEAQVKPGGSPPSQAPLVWTQETRVGAAESFGAGRMPSRGSLDVCCQQKLTGFVLSPAMFAECLLCAWPWAGLCSQGLRSGVWQGPQGSRLRAMGH